MFRTSGKREFLYKVLDNREWKPNLKLDFSKLADHAFIESFIWEQVAWKG